MNRRIVILGAGIAGLASAIALVRRGYPVTVVERDPPPPPDTDLDPFTGWNRRGVPQFRLPHGFSARVRNLLAVNAPDVLDRLRADGIEEINLFKRLMPAELWEPGDDEFTNIWARRAVVELALRLTAQAEPDIEFQCPAVVRGLRFVHPAAGPPQVTGVQLADGRELAAGIVLNCGGLHSPVPRWLAAEGIHVPTEVQDCKTVYYSRYYRFTAGCDLPKATVATLRGDFSDGSFIGFPGDHETYAFSFECHPDSLAARRLRDPAYWETTARSLPMLAPWIEPANGTPLDGVQVMGGNRNTNRRYVIDDRPVVLGLLAVGDALCTTNPAYGWGAAMALTSAFAAVEAIVGHAPDLVATVTAYEAVSSAEADAVYRESAAMDRARIYRITGQDVPEGDRAEMERQHLMAEALAGGALNDIHLCRAFNRRVNLVGPAHTVLDGADLVRSAQRTRGLTH